MDAEAGFGRDGSVKYSVHLTAPIRVTATLVAVTRVDDLSAAGDRTMLRTVLTEGGDRKPIDRYECKVDFLRRHPTAARLAPTRRERAEAPARRAGANRAAGGRRRDDRAGDG